MKTTILKASKQLAETVANDLLSRKTPKGNPIFTKTEIEHGFEIHGPKIGPDNKVMRDDNGKIVKGLILQYTNEKGRQKITYDENMLTFQD